MIRIVETAMSKRLVPSMTALQCFEAAARHLSFTRAAEELHLTQSAVSKQVAQPEDIFGRWQVHAAGRSQEAECW